jgi:hypothetical protein
MKKITILSILLSAAAVNLHGLQLSGTAATTVANLVPGNSSFVIVDTTGGDTLNSSAFTVGLTLTAGTSFGDYYVAAYNNVAGGFGVSVAGNALFNLGDGTTAGGDTFYVVAFGTNSGDGITLSGGDTYGILAGGNWQLDGNNSGIFSYGAGPTDLNQFGTANGAEFSVVPEPSTYAALAGLLALGYVMVRRRS